MTDGWIGGTPLVAERSGDGWIALVREDAERSPGKRTELHRVVRFGRDWRLTHWSHPFRFQRSESEVAAGLARHGDDLLISFSAANAQCWVAAMPEADLLALLRPAADFEVPAPTAGRFPSTWDEVLAAPAFVINLDRRPDRLALAAHRLHEAGFRDIRRVQAIDGQHSEMMRAALASLGWPALHPGDTLFARQAGRQGCFLSMALTLAWIVEHRIPLATIFEDDALFHSRWDTLAPAFYAETPRDIDLLYLGGQAEAWNPGDEHLLPTVEWLPPLREETDWRAAPRVLRKPTYKLGAFAITLDGARTILKRLLNFPGGVHSVDNMMNHLQRLALAGIPEYAFDWATWNATAEPDPAADWLPLQRMGETGLVFQQIELGTDIDTRWLELSEPSALAAREALRAAGASEPMDIAEQIAEAERTGRAASLPVVPLVSSRIWQGAARAAASDLTLVSVLVYLELSSADPQRRIDLLGPLFAAGIPLVLYLDQYYATRLDPNEIPPWVTLRLLEREDLDLVKMIAGLDPAPTLPATRTITKDTIEYLGLMNAKTEVVARAVREGLVTTPYTGFIDSGVAKLFTDQDAAFRRIAEADLTGLDRVLIPGCWPIRPVEVGALVDAVSWVFCGTLFLLPAAMAERFHALELEALDAFLAQGRLAWEVNVWAYLAGQHPEVFHWYLSDHNDRLTVIPRIGPASRRDARHDLPDLVDRKDAIPVTDVVDDGAARLLAPQYRHLAGKLAGDDGVIGSDEMPFASSTRVGPIWGHPADQVILPYIRRTGDWAPPEGDFAVSFLRPGMNVLDVGANIGYLTRLFSRAVGPDGTVIAVEANPGMYSVLLRNIGQPESRNVVALNLAAGDRFGHAAIDRAEEQNGNPSANQVVMVEHPEDAGIQMLPLDAALDPSARIDFIKVDVEGLDDRVLAGLERTIEVYKPAIIAEWNPKAMRRIGGDPAAAILGYLDKGWRVFVLDSVIDSFRLQLGLRQRLANGNEITREVAEWMQDIRFDQHLGMSVVSLLLQTDPAANLDAPEPVYYPPSLTLTFTESVDAYYQGRIADGMAACEHLLSREDASELQIQDSLRNQVFYARPLGELVLETDIHYEAECPESADDPRDPMVVLLGPEEGEDVLLERLAPVVALRRDGSEVEHAEDAIHPLVRNLTPAAGAISFEDGWLLVAAQRAWFDTGEWRTLHRLIWLDLSYRIAGLSDAFWFVDRERERCLDLAWRDGMVVFTVQPGDGGGCVVVEGPIADIGALLVPIDARDEALLVPLPLPPDADASWPADFRAESYMGLLRYLHEYIKPDAYLEIGVENGVS
ncbi:MAG: FkbM family methyltransferase, partial [Thermomicrobiales bacterium]